MTRLDDSDLEAILADLGERGFDIALADDRERLWIRLDEYAADPGILDAGLRLAGSRFHLPDVSAITGGALVGDIAATVAWPAAAAILTRQTLLITRPVDVYLPPPDSGRRLTARITASGPCVPASPDAFADAIVTTLRPVVEAVHARTRRGRHALWATVTDMVAAAFHRVGDQLRRPDEARTFASAALTGHPSLPGGANWHDVAWSGGVEETRIRNVCCLWYQTPGGKLCLTCPRITDRDRVSILARRDTG